MQVDFITNKNMIVFIKINKSSSDSEQSVVKINHWRSSILKVIVID